MDIAYNGTAYHGWQRQPNGNSVQATLENALSLLLGRQTAVTGAGRTDAGVHARQMIAHFDTEVPLSSTETLVHRLNALLPADIAVYRIWQVGMKMHARFSAVARSYEYHVCTRKDVFLESTALRVPPDTDFAAMNRAAARLLHYRDFTSFSKLHTDVKTNHCVLTRAEWKPVAKFHWMFCIDADRFLRNMVRAIVGSLLEVGAGKIDEAGFCRIIEQKNRCAAGTSVPAKALFLTQVRY